MGKRALGSAVSDLHAVEQAGLVGAGDRHHVVYEGDVILAQDAVGDITGVFRYNLPLPFRVGHGKSVDLLVFRDFCSRPHSADKKLRHFPVCGVYYLSCVIE